MANTNSKSVKSSGVVSQVRAALQPKARLATCLGFLLGGFVPLASYVVAHHEIDPSKPLYLQVATAIVLGGLVYSARTVYEWGKMAFQSPFKATGFVLLTEGIMVTAQSRWLAIAALAYLIVINGVATGCNLSLRKDDEPAPAEKVTAAASPTVNAPSTVKPPSKKTATKSSRPVVPSSSMMS